MLAQIDRTPIAAFYAPEFACSGNANECKQQRNTYNAQVHAERIRMRQELKQSVLAATVAIEQHDYIGARDLLAGASSRFDGDSGGDSSDDWIVYANARVAAHRTFSLATALVRSQIQN